MSSPEITWILPCGFVLVNAFEENKSRAGTIVAFYLLNARSTES